MYQLVDQLVSKWQCTPESQHTPLCAHLLGLAMKAVTQLALGDKFANDAEVIRFRKNHDAVRHLCLECFVETVLSSG